MKYTCNKNGTAPHNIYSIIDSQSWSLAQSIQNLIEHHELKIKIYFVIPCHLLDKMIRYATVCCVTFKLLSCVLYSIAYNILCTTRYMMLGMCFHMLYTIVDAKCDLLSYLCMCSFLPYDMLYIITILQSRYPTLYALNSMHSIVS